MLNLLGHDQAALGTYLEQFKEKPFRSKQIIKWIHQHGLQNFVEMSNIPTHLRHLLTEHCNLSIPPIRLEEIADDGVIKWLFELEDGNIIETVFIPEKTRGTLCISSQVGCYLDCRFCATGLQGFNRNLASAEIIAQLWLAQKRLQQLHSTPAWQHTLWNGQPPHHRISNVVFMGMGEPLLNLQSVSRAVNLMLDDDAYGLSKRRVTISTAGVAPMVRQLSQHNQASLAISLHSADDITRSELVPLNKKYPLKVLLDACWHYVKSHQQKRHILFEYIMLKGVNDHLNDAKQLAKLLRNFPAKVNLIPFNPYPGLPYECSTEQQIEKFQHYLKQASIKTTLRKTRGQSIDAACGQLAGKINNRIKRRQTITFNPTDYVSSVS